MEHNQIGEPGGRRRAIVTGGNAGIGRATVVSLAALGWDVSFTYNSHTQEASATLDLAREHGTVVRSVQVDFAQLDHARAALDHIIRDLGGVDLLVNNAAVNTRAALLDMTPEQWRRTLDVNCTAALVALQLAAADMRTRRNGTIINVTSVVGTAPLEQASAYCASKAALEMLTRVAALELARWNIRVIAIAPGHTITRMNFGDDWDSMTEAPALPIAPVGRSAQPDEIAAFIAFIAHAQPGYLTGTTITVDGGLLCASGPNTLQQQTGVPLFSD